MESFFASSETPPVAVIASKKRKKAHVEVGDDIKKKARLYCTCPEQWKSVSRYNAERLTQFCEEYEFRQQSELHTTVFDFAQRVLALGMDTVLGARGYVQTEIQNDLSLRKAIELEAGNWVSFLSNRFQIVSLLAIDSASGKMNQRRDEPVVEISIEEEENGCLPTSADCSATTLGEEPTFDDSERDLPGSPVCFEAVDNAICGEEGLGEIVQPSPTTL